LAPIQEGGHQHHPRGDQAFPSLKTA
jgi:hypothetical protein